MKNCWNVMASALVAAAALTVAHPAAAQETRANPFLPNPTSDEERINAERERLRQSIREMMPEIKSLLAPTLAEERLAITEKARTEAIEAIKSSDDFKKLIEAAKAPASANGGAPALGPDGKPDPKRPGGAPGAQAANAPKQVGCINGKGLFRDSGGITFIDQSGSLGGGCS